MYGTYIRFGLVNMYCYEIQSTKIWSYDKGNEEDDDDDDNDDDDDDDGDDNKSAEVHIYIHICT